MTTCGEIAGMLPSSAEALTSSLFLAWRRADPALVLEEAICRMEKTPLSLAAFARTTGRTPDGYKRAYGPAWARAKNNGINKH